jgi:predicted HNH restriction endonuclease
MSKTYKKWNQPEIQFIVDNQNMLDKEIAEKLSQTIGQNITQNMVRRQRRKSGILRKRGRPSKKALTT